MSTPTREECIGDGNCLFRALGDQLDGQVQEHMAHREAVVRYMRHHRWLISTSISTPIDFFFRDDFEPFVEDDISFDDHVSSLSEQGTFGGNDAIVAWARLHLCTVVIHQLNKPLWQVRARNCFALTCPIIVSQKNTELKMVFDFLGPYLFFGDLFSVFHAKNSESVCIHSVLYEKT